MSVCHYYSIVGISSVFFTIKVELQLLDIIAVVDVVQGLE